MPMKTISATLAGSLIIVSGILGIMFGYYITPEYQQHMYAKDTMDIGEADRWADLRYMNMMIAHHRGAMLLAEQAYRHGQRDEIKQLASDILRTEPVLIEELYNLRRRWYGDARRVKDPETVNLGTADDTFDLRFLNALIAHHEAGVKMAREVRGVSQRREILDNADAVEYSLSSSSAVLRKWRLDWYNVQ